MTTLDGQPLFASGPSSLAVGSWRRERIDRPLCGLDGQVVIDMGLRDRKLTQTGRLCGSTAAEVQASIDAINVTVDGRPRTLVDNHGRLFARVVVESFEPGTLRRDQAFWCDYTITYRQLP